MSTSRGPGAVVRPRSAGRDLRLVARLALADMRYEIVLTLCIVFAITAIVAPLLLLLGLKHGTVEHQLRRLVEDPVYREVRPLRVEEFAPEWFPPVAAREDVVFLIPNILRGASSVQVQARDGEPVFVDMLPSGEGDPLLLENGTRPPGSGEVVVTSQAREALGAETGGRIAVTVSRGGREPQTLDLEVVGVLEPRADPLARLYVDFPTVEDIETYRSGRAVAARGWPGETQRPIETFDGVLVSSGAPLGRRDRILLRDGTGLTEVTEIDAAAAADRLGVPVAPEPGRELYLLTARGGTAQAANIAQARNKARRTETQPDLIPFARPVSATLQAGDGAALSTAVVGLEGDALGGPAIPWSASIDRDAPYERLAQAVAPAGAGLGVGDAARLSVDFPTYSISIPITVAGVWEGEATLVPLALHAMLRSGFDRRVAYDEGLEDLVSEKDGYRGFRLYARSIDDVAGLNRHFLDQGVEVVTQAQDIDRVRRMDRALTRLFQFVATIGLLGGVLAMLASLYAAVERKKRDLGVMRLLGISRRAIFGFPVTQSAVIGAVATAAAVLVFLVFAEIVNRHFAADLPLGRRLAFLPPVYFVYALGLAVGVSLLSSLFAASRATRIDPAEAIREE